MDPNPDKLSHTARVTKKASSQKPPFDEIFEAVWEMTKSIEDSEVRKQVVARFMEYTAENLTGLRDALIKAGVNPNTLNSTLPASKAPKK